MYIIQIQLIELEFDKLEKLNKLVLEFDKNFEKFENNLKTLPKHIVTKGEMEESLS